MGDGTNNQGEAPQAVTPEQMQAAIFGMILELSPADLPQEVAAQHFQFAFEMEMREDFQLAFDALFNPEKVKDKPMWGVRLHHRSLAQPHLIYGPKRLDEQTSLPHLSSFALTYGLLTSPPLRAVLMAHGYRIEFVEIAPKSPIITM